MRFWRRMPEGAAVCGGGWRRAVSGFWAVVWVWGWTAGVVVCGAPMPSAVYTGCCDASAAAEVNGMVFAVASDEGNALRLYRKGAGGSPLAVLGGPAGAGGHGREEADLEAAARLGDLIFWIGSHSRNADGKVRPARHVLFATRVRGEGLDARLETAGRPFRGLLAALVADPRLAAYGLGRAAERAGEAEGGLNIEALAEGKDGSLLVGFRNPVPEGRALLVPILNPTELIEGRSPRLGMAMTVALGGLGLRDACRSGDRLFLLAGPAEGGGRHRLFVWREGVAAASEIAGAVPKGFPAESLLVSGEGNSGFLDLFSDDGGEKIRGVRCEDLPDPAGRSFRMVRVRY